MIKIISLCIFLFGYVIISQERFLHASKTAVSLIIGIALWEIVVLSGSPNIDHALVATGSQIFSLFIFLLSAMTLVEILISYGFFDAIYNRLIKLGFKDKQQFFVIASLTFCFSSFLDNLTTTIVMIQIARGFFRGTNLLKMGAMIVIAANAGGAFSPIGDVTTTMLWLAEKFTAIAIILNTILPSLTVFFVSAFLIGRTILQDSTNPTERPKKLGKIEIGMITLCLLSFSFPLLMALLQLPPYFGLLLGLGIVWLVFDVLRHQGHINTRMSETIEKLFQRNDISSLYFFIGILLAIGALEHLGVLADISRMIFTSEPTTDTLIRGSILVGIASSIFDNVPLTAAALNILKTSDTTIWTFLAFTVGVGGSLLIIGSAPGIIAMTLIKELTFTKYLKIATLPALLAYFSGVAVWYAQFHFFH